MKDLGVFISSDLSWHANVLEVCRKANFVCNTILHSFKSHDILLYMRAFDTYVRPIVEYCCYVWNPTLCYDIDLIENV
jgi:hypothetical protein